MCLHQTLKTMVHDNLKGSFALGNPLDNLSSCLGFCILPMRIFQLPLSLKHGGNQLWVQGTFNCCCRNFMCSLPYPPKQQLHLPNTSWHASSCCLWTWHPPCPRTDVLLSTCVYIPMQHIKKCGSNSRQHTR